MDGRVIHCYACQSPQVVYNRSEYELVSWNCCDPSEPRGLRLRHKQPKSPPCRSYQQCLYCLNTDTRRLKDPLELRGTNPYQYECHCCGAFWHWDYDTNQRMLEKEQCHADLQPSTPSETPFEETPSKT